MSRITDASGKIPGLIAFAEAISYPVLATSNEGWPVWCNRPWRTYTGLSARRLRAQGWSALVHPDDLELFEESWKACRGLRKVFDHECRICSADGGFRTNRLKFVPARGPVSSEAIWIAVSEDVQDQRTAREALRLGEQRFQAAIQDSHTTVFSQDSSLRYTWVCNPVPGYSEADMLGRTDFDLFEPAEAMALTEIKASVCADDQPRRAVLQLTCAGSRLFYDAKFVPLVAADGGICGLTSVMTNVTDMKTTELALRSSEESLRTVLNASFDAIISIDSRSRITLWAGSAQEIFGWTAEEALGSFMPELIMPERFRKEHEAGMNRYLTTSEAPLLGKRVQVTGMRCCGEEFAMELSLARLPGSTGQVFTAFVRDLSAGRCEMRREAS